jgi:hypothetical protein
MALAAAGLLLAGAAGWSLYQSRTTPRVPYARLQSFDGVELRRYPSTVVVETTARTQNEAFRRLFRYISGENTGRATVSMTSPVELDTPEGTEIAMTAPVEVASPGAKVPMTAPVETDRSAGTVRMAFYLPMSFDYATAPWPTDPNVRLLEVPERILAVKRFSWWPTEKRVERQTAALLASLDAADVRTVGEPFRMGYDAPGTPPFLRTNEVAIEVRQPSA